MSQKSILSFFKPPNGKVHSEESIKINSSPDTNINVESPKKEINSSPDTNINVESPEKETNSSPDTNINVKSPEKEISRKRRKKVKIIVESDEETCENSCSSNKECTTIANVGNAECSGLQDEAVEGIQDEEKFIKSAKRKTARKAVIISKPKNGTFENDQITSSIENADAKVSGENTEESVGGNLHPEIEPEGKKKQNSVCKNISESKDICKNKIPPKNILIAKNKCERGLRQNKLLNEIKTESEEQEKFISDKDPEVSPNDQYSDKRKRNRNKRKDSEREDIVDIKSSKKPRKAKYTKKSVKANYSSDDGSELRIENEQLCETKTEDFPDTTKKETDSIKHVSHKSSPFQKFFTSQNCEKGKPTKKNSSQEEKSCIAVLKSDTVYDPSKKHYHPIDDACWKRGEKVPYLALAKTMEAIENISGRLKTIEIFANFLRSVIVLSPDDLLHSVYLCLNKLAPEYMGIEMGIGESLLVKAVAQATGRSVEKIKAEVTLKGDLGLVAENSRGSQRVMFAPPKLTISSVFKKFKEIAEMSGNAAMTKKVDKIQSLFVACRMCEAKYIIRSLSGKLRIGMAEQSVLAALAQAATLTPPNQLYPPEIINASVNISTEAFKKKLESQTLILKTTYCECPNYDMMIPALLKEGIEELPKHCYLSPGIPLKPMLAHPTKGIDEVLRRFDNNEFTCEFKYDGERAQIHIMDDREVKIYSRNQEDNTSKYPDVVSRITNALNSNTKSCILDTEAVAWDMETKQILPFQVLSTRKRKDAVESEITVQVCIVAFDLLYLNGESLVKHPLKVRRRLLLEHFCEVENQFLFVKYTDGNKAEVMQEFLDESIKGNCEGLMVKSLEVDASYEIAKRSHNWLKLKKDYLDGVGDTLDLVVIGGFHGKGKRCGGYGGFLLACYDDENEEFQSICKIGTGIKEDEFESHTTYFKEHIIAEPKPYYRFDNSLEPDVWFEPVQVWEVKCADLSISPVHKASVGMVDPEKGISLRFPRFLRIRNDKKAEEATTASQVACMYNNQDQVQNQVQKCRAPQIEDEDFY